MDERVLLGSGWAHHESLRSIAFRSVPPAARRSGTTLTAGRAGTA